MLAPSHSRSRDLRRSRIVEVHYLMSKMISTLNAVMLERNGSNKNNLLATLSTRCRLILQEWPKILMLIDVNLFANFDVRNSQWRYNCVRLCIFLCSKISNQQTFLLNIIKKLLQFFLVNIYMVVMSKKRSSCENNAEVTFQLAVHLSNSVIDV